MSDGQFLSALSRILYQNSSNFSGNQLFGLVSLILLLEIVEIFKQETIAQPAVPESRKSKSELPDLSSISGLLSQLPGKGNGDGANSNNLQQMLPLLMGALSGNMGGGNSGPDIGSLMQLLNSVNLKPQANNTETRLPEDEELEEDQGEGDAGDKKKAP